jgi:hypothetical protein
MTLVNNYVPGDWPEVLAERDANKAAYGHSGTELSTVQPPTEAAVAALGLSGDDRKWSAQIVTDAVGAPSTLTPDIQGKQASKTPYVSGHLYP